MDFTNLALALLAGVFSILSPCVLPLVPIVLGGALSEHRYGPVALAAGLALSFLVIGMFVATIGYSVGLDEGVFRTIAALLLVAIGVVLLLPRLQAQVALAAGPVGQWTNQRFGGASTSGLNGQFGVGLLLGAVWTPCVGPTLGAASVLAAQGKNLGQVALTMLVFAVGTATPLLLLASLSRAALKRWRGNLMAAGTGGKMALGCVLVASGVLILIGLDKTLEAGLVQILPQWMLQASARF